MNLKKMAWLLVVVIAVLVAPVTKIQSASTVTASSVSHDGAGPVAPPIPW
jgi:hypothetical protein